MSQPVDEAIGGNPAYGIAGIMAHIGSLGIADDAMGMLLWDHVWFCGEHSVRAKNDPHEEAVRPPPFVYPPEAGAAAPHRTRFALNIDLAPTLAELAGVALPVTHDGASLVRVLDGTAPVWRTDSLTEGWPGTHPWAAVRDGQWKYTEMALDPGNPLTPSETELYDLAAVPYPGRIRRKIPATSDGAATPGARDGGGRRPSRSARRRRRSARAVRDRTDRGGSAAAVSGWPVATPAWTAGAESASFAAPMMSLGMWPVARRAEVRPAIGAEAPPPYVAGRPRLLDRLRTAMRT